MEQTLPCLMQRLATQVSPLESVFPFLAGVTVPSGAGPDGATVVVSQQWHVAGEFLTLTRKFLHEIFPIFDSGELPDVVRNFILQLGTRRVLVAMKGVDLAFGMDEKTFFNDQKRDKHVNKFFNRKTAEKPKEAARQAGARRNPSAAPPGPMQMQPGAMQQFQQYAHAMQPPQQQWAAWGGPVTPAQPTFFNPVPPQFAPPQQFFQGPQQPQFAQQAPPYFPRYVANQGQPMYGQFASPAAGGILHCSKCYKQFQVDGASHYSHQYGSPGFPCRILCFYCKRDGVTTKTCPNPACQQRAQAAASPQQL